MTDSRLERFAAAAGVGAVVLFVIAFFVAGTPPKLDEGAGAIASYFTDDRGAILTARYLEGIGVILLIWFLGALISVLNAAGQARLAVTALGAGLVMLAVAGVGYTANAALAHSAAGVDEGAAHTLYSVSLVSYTATSFPLAALALATGVAVLRTGVLPRWFGGLSLIGAAYFLVNGAAWASDGFFAPDGAIGVIGFFVFAGWILVTSVLLTQHVAGHEEAPRPATAAT